jgi:hypothetical protein
MLYVFDLRSLPLGDHKKRLARLVGKRRIGIVLSEPTEKDGALLFVHACRMGLEYHRQNGLTGCGGLRESGAALPLPPAGNLASAARQSEPRKD